MASKAVKKILVLHGYSQNATIISKRLGALRKEAKDLEYVFINAPHVLLPSETFGAPTRFDSVSEAPSIEQIQENPDLALRGWWRTNKERTRAFGLEESIMAVREVLREQKFDGVFGFSQGAAFAAVLSALLERPHLYQPFLVDGQSPHPPFQFCVAVSGFKILDPFCQAYFEPKYETPTLHVIGLTDVVVIEERSQQLAAVSANGLVVTHEGGHFVPSKTNWRKFFVEYMRDPSGKHTVPAPGAVEGGGAAGGDYKTAVMTGMKL